MSLAAGDYGLGALRAAAQERERLERMGWPLVAVALTAETRKRALALLERPDSPLNMAWLKTKLDGKNRLPDDVLAAARAGAKQAGPEAVAVVEELVQAHHGAIEETARQARRRQYEAEQAERQRRVDERAAEWRAVDRPEQERIILLEHFTKESPGTARDLILATSELAELTDAELDELVPGSFRPLDDGETLEPALQRHRDERRFHTWRALSPQRRAQAVLVDRAIQSLPVLEIGSVDADEPPPRTWRP